MYKNTKFTVDEKTLEKSKSEEQKKPISFEKTTVCKETEEESTSKAENKNSDKETSEPSKSCKGSEEKANKSEKKDAQNKETLAKETAAKVSAHDEPKSKVATEKSTESEKTSESKKATETAENSTKACERSSNKNNKPGVAKPPEDQKPVELKGEEKANLDIKVSESASPADKAEKPVTNRQAKQKSSSLAQANEKQKLLETDFCDSPSDSKDRKSKRHRLKTILYQSPLPEYAYITKLSASEASNSPKPVTGDDKLIVFYKNEYLAVRNAEGTFYLCQTMQNVYRTSPRISIRWLSEDAKDGNVYIPDFYDHTDIECVLTTVDLKRVDKGHMRLPKLEKSRIESILKKAIDVERGLAPRPELTEENPDGLDLSLFKDESQIEKKGTATASTPTSRRTRRSTTLSDSSNSPHKNNKRKRNTSHSSKGSPPKQQKTVIKKRKTPSHHRKKGKVSDGDTSDDYTSDKEYRPSQKNSSDRAVANSSRTQRSSSQKNKSVLSSPSVSVSKNKNAATKASLPTASNNRTERANKRKLMNEEMAETDASQKKQTVSSVSLTGTNTKKETETACFETLNAKKTPTDCAGSSTATGVDPPAKQNPIPSKAKEAENPSQSLSSLNTPTSSNMGVSNANRSTRNRK